MLKITSMRRRTCDPSLTRGVTQKCFLWLDTSIGHPDAIPYQQCRALGRRNLQHTTISIQFKMSARIQNCRPGLNLLPGIKMAEPNASALQYWKEAFDRDAWAPLVPQFPINKPWLLKHIDYPLFSVLDVKWSPSRGFRQLVASSLSWGNFCPDQRQHYHQLLNIHLKSSIYKPNQESAYKAAKVSIRVSTLASTPKILVKFSVHHLSHIHTSNTVHPLTYIHTSNTVHPLLKERKWAGPNL